MALGDILGGAASGALTGFGFGGPIGALIGGLGGGALGSLGGTKHDPFTRAGKVEQFDVYTPQQKNLLNQINAILTGQGKTPQTGLLGQLFGEEGFDAYAKPAMRAYEEEIVPGLAERFTAAGGQRSSAFQNALARSGENLAMQLGEMRARQQQQLLGSLLGPSLGQQFYSYYTPPSPTGLSQFLGGAGGELAKGAGSALAQMLQQRMMG